MNAAASKSPEKSQAAVRKPVAAREAEQRPERVGGDVEALLALQESVGNRAVTELLRGSSGKPLDRSTRREMETKFGADFGEVRVHTGRPASDSAIALGAKAWTAGDDIVFDDGLFAPKTTAGKKLLAHELAHVVQQRRGGASPRTFDPSSAAEHDAARAAAQVTTAGPIAVSAATGAGVARDEAELPWWKKQLNPMYQKALEVLPKGAADKLREANAVAKDFVQTSGVGDESLNKAVKTAEPVLQPIAAALGVNDGAAGRVQAPVAAAPTGEQGVADEVARITAPPRTETTPQPTSPQPTFQWNLAGDQARASGSPGGVHEEASAEGEKERPVEWDRRRFLARAIEDMGGMSFDTDKVPVEKLEQEFSRLQEKQYQKEPEEKPREFQESKDPPDRRSRYITIHLRGADPDNPIPSETIEVFATADEAEQMVQDDSNEFAGRAFATALMSAGELAARGPAGPGFGGMRETQWGAALEAPASHVATQGVAAEHVPFVPGASFAGESPVTPGSGTKAVGEEPTTVQPPITAAPGTTDATKNAGAPSTLDQLTYVSVTKLKPQNDVRLPYPHEQFEDSAAKKSAEENQVPTTVLGTGKFANPRSAGLDLVNKKELTQVKAYTGSSAATRVLKDLKKLSGIDAVGPGQSQAEKAAADMETLKQRMAASGKTLELPPGYDANPSEFIRQNTVFRIPDDLVGPVRSKLIEEVMDSHTYENYGLPGPLNRDAAETYANRRIQKGGMAEGQLK